MSTETMTAARLIDPNEGERNAVAIPKPTTAIEVREARGITITGLPDLYAFAQLYAKSGMAPKGMSPEAIAISIQTGMELGLSPAQSVQSIAVINGRPSVYGPTAQALIEASGLLADFDFYFEESGQRADHPTKFDDSTAAVCTTLRKGRKRPYTTRFSVADAKRAGLWGKPGPWTQYPQRMLKWRCTSHNFADNFGDVLKGLDAGDVPSDGATEINVVVQRAAARRQEPRQEQPANPERANYLDIAREAYRLLVDGGLYGPEQMSADLALEPFKVDAVSQLDDAGVKRWAEYLAAKVDAAMKANEGDQSDAA